MQFTGKRYTEYIDYAYEMSKLLDDKHVKCNVLTVVTRHKRFIEDVINDHNNSVRIIQEYALREAIMNRTTKLLS